MAIRRAWGLCVRQCQGAAWKISNYRGEGRNLLISIYLCVSLHGVLQIKSTTLLGIKGKTANTEAPTNKSCKRGINTQFLWRKEQQRPKEVLIAVLHVCMYVYAHMPRGCKKNERTRSARVIPFPVAVEVCRVLKIVVESSSCKVGQTSLTGSCFLIGIYMNVTEMWKICLTKCIYRVPLIFSHFLQSLFAEFL